jgi:hypothetical protein
VKEGEMRDPLPITLDIIMPADDVDSEVDPLWVLDSLAVLER